MYQEIVQIFKHARQNATPLVSYPLNQVPGSLVEAYKIQDMAIDGWPDQVAGWKVAAIQEKWRHVYHEQRLAGPIFSSNVYPSDITEFFVIQGGYAAVECEFAIKLSDAFPESHLFTSPEEFLPYIASVHPAIEMAGSPLHSISALGPGAAVSDFGNNSGLIVGPAFHNFFDLPLTEWTSDAHINRQHVGEGSADRIPGGPLSALHFLNEHLLNRKKSLRPGDFISTGASTGIHVVKPGDSAMIYFRGEKIFDLHFREKKQG